MRLISRVKPKRASEIEQFKEIESIFNCFLEKNINVTKTIKDIKKLNFFFVIEYKNTFTDKTLNEVSTIVKQNDFSYSFGQTSDLKKDPNFFHLLGHSAEIIGCYFIAIKESSINSAKKYNLQNITSGISVKLDNDKLPSEFKKMCEKFHKIQKIKNIKKQEEIDSFIHFNENEQEEIVSDILGYKQIIQEPLNDNIVYSGGNLVNTFELAAEQNIDNINNIEFLTNMLNSALVNENYEFCAKIRDRIYYLRMI